MCGGREHYHSLISLMSDQTMRQMLDKFQLENLEQAALLCERIRDTQNQLSNHHEAEGAEKCRAAIQATANILRLKSNADG